MSSKLTALIVLASYIALANGLCDGPLCKFVGYAPDGTRLYMDYTWVVVGCSIGGFFTILLLCCSCHRRRQLRETYARDEESAIRRRQNQQYNQFPSQYSAGLARPEAVHQPMQQYPFAPQATVPPLPPRYI